MKAKIIFNLDNLDDRIKYKKYFKSEDMFDILFELLLNQKKKIRWEIENKDLDKYDTLDLIFEKISQLAYEYNINIEELNNGI